MGKKELTKNEKLDILIPKTMSVLYDTVQKSMPEKGTFRKLFVFFEYPETKYEGILWVEPNLTGQEGNGRLVSGMRQTGSDRVVQHYMMAGAKAEIMEWLGNDRNISALQSDYEQLKRSVDRFD